MTKKYKFESNTGSIVKWYDFSHVLSCLSYICDEVSNYIGCQFCFIKDHKLRLDKS